MAPKAAEDAGPFLAWVEAAPREELIAGLVALDEGRRRRLAKPVAQAWRAAHPESWIHRDWRLDAAVAAVCAWSDARRLRTSTAYREPKEAEGVLLEVLAGRRPDWLERWVEQELAATQWTSAWPLVRALVRRGACPAPSTDDYIIQMVRCRAGSWARDASLADGLRADPGLLAEEIWRTFEVDPTNGNLFQYDEGEWHPGAGSKSWGPALVQLASEGAIDRFRLLEASAEALRRGIQIKGTGFHIRLHERLEPTLDEGERLAPAYLDLLAHRVDAVAKFALRQLAPLIEAQRVDGGSLVERIPAVLQRETKGPAVAGLAALRAVVGRNPELAAAAAEAATFGLGHAEPEVQGAALSLIEAAAPAESAAVASSITTRLDQVAASQRGRAQALATKLAGSSAAAPVADAVAVPPRAPRAVPDAKAPPPDLPDLQQLLARARALPDETRRLAGIDDLLAAFGRGEEPPPWAPPASELPRCEAGAEVAPIGSLDELIDVLLALLESCEDSIEVERALDGLCRLGGERPPDFDARIAALAQRVRQPASGFGEMSAISGLLASAILGWLDGPQPAGRLAYTLGRKPGPEHFFAARLDEVETRARAGPRCGLLAMPTHRGGWIDARRFVPRVREHLAAGSPLGELDLIQALLRLAPEGRAEALAAARELRGTIGQLVRFALGASGVEPAARQGWWAAVTSVGKGPADRPLSWPAWIAAARARRPFDAVPEMEATPVGAEAFAARPPVYRWQVRWREKKWGSPDPSVVIELDPPLGPREPSRPLALLCREQQQWSFGSTADVRFAQLVWPIDPSPTLVAGCGALCDRLFRPSSAYTPTAVYLEPLFSPATPFGELAQLLAGLALVAQDADARTTALDVVAQLVRDGRCRGDELGRVYGSIQRQQGLLKPGRVAEAIEQLRPHGSLHELACLRLLVELLATIEEPPRDLFHLLQAYHELLTASGSACDARVLPLLQRTGGSGKTARLAKLVAEAKCDETLHATRRDEAYAALLEERVGWARRIGEVASP